MSVSSLIPFDSSFNMKENTTFTQVFMTLAVLNLVD